MQSYPTQPPDTGYNPSQPADVHVVQQPIQPQGIQSQQQPQYVQGEAPPGQYVQPAVVPPNAVTQQQAVYIIVPPAVTPTVYEKYKAKQSIVLGKIQVAVGLFSVILNVIGIGLQIQLYSIRRRYGHYSDNISLYYISYGIWCSILYLLAGSYAIAAGKRKTQCHVIASLVLSIIAAVFVWIQIGMAAASVGIDAETNRWFYPSNYDYESERELFDADWGLVQGSLAVGCFLLIMGLLEFVVAVWCSVLGCRVAYCCNYTPAKYATSSRQVVSINSNGQPEPQTGDVATYPGQPLGVGSGAADEIQEHVQPAVVPPNDVTQPQGVHIIAPAVTPTVYEKYNAKQSIVLGGTQVAVGLVSIILNAIGIWLQNKFREMPWRYDGYFSADNLLYYFGYGFWCSTCYILAGSFAIAAGQRKTKGPVRASLVQSIIAAVFVWNQIGMAAASVGIDAGTRREYRIRISINYSPYHRYEWTSLSDADWELVQKSLAVGCLLLILGLLEFVVAVWCSVLGCRAAASTPLSYVAGSQQVVYTNSGGQLVPQAGYVATNSGQPVAVGTVAAYPIQPGAVGAVAPTSATPYVPQTMIPNQGKSGEMAGQEAPPSYDNP